MNVDPLLREQVTQSFLCQAQVLPLPVPTQLPTFLLHRKPAAGVVFKLDGVRVLSQVFLNILAKRKQSENDC